ncbi:MAG: ribosome assembly cofactor RimP [Prevotellaceae bacterium]|jgi:ribosome maturation factor RimP|nr:ribosome assembly cofactor RimP [Prevotellaceae bacterium]
MISTESIATFVAQHVAGSDIFLVGVSVSPRNEIEVLADRPQGLSIDDCASISRAIESAFSREAEDYELTVSSPGIGEPLQVLPQFIKAVGRPVEVLLKSGQKLQATLLSATADTIELEYATMELLEGKKRKQAVRHAPTLRLDELKWVKECI